MAKKKTATVTVAKPKKQNPWGVPTKRFPLMIFMALVKFGNGVSGMSGKIAGTVFSRNTYGAIARNWVNPVDPQTTSQMANRAAFGDLSQKWRVITSAQQLGWITLASTVTFLNRLGETIHLSGQALYSKLNRNLQSAGQTRIDDAPVYTIPDGPTAFSVAADTTLPSIVVTFAPTPVAVGSTLQIYATPALSAGKRYTNGLYKLIVNLENPTATGEDIVAEYELIYGSGWKDPSLKIGFRARIVDNSTGVASALTQFIAQVTT